MFPPPHLFPVQGSTLHLRLSCKPLSMSEPSVSHSCLHPCASACAHFYHAVGLAPLTPPPRTSGVSRQHRKRNLPTDGAARRRIHEHHTPWAGGNELHRCQQLAHSYSRPPHRYSTGSSQWYISGGCKRLSNEVRHQTGSPLESANRLGTRHQPECWGAVGVERC
jgi:hypothetical protein